MPFFTSFSGYDPDAFPVPQNDPPAQPAGYAFSIWGPIYLVLILSTGWGAFRHPDDPDWAPARVPLLISLLIGAAWLPIAAVNPLVATVLIWMMLIAGLVALARTPATPRLAFRAPVALYCGWLAAASWVSVALTGAGYDLVFGPYLWALIAIVAATATALAVLARIPDIPEFSAAVIWAFVALVVANWSVSPGVAALAAASALVVLAMQIIRIRDSRQSV
ncbi:MAG: hypothetical protein KJO67_10620 [Silicimonas sp.]|nr:hypothetical protein [Silicimonas sp.]NNL36459.1 hypothetical protein [Silicimonas sp.]